MVQRGDGSRDPLKTDVDVVSLSRANNRVGGPFETVGGAWYPSRAGSEADDTSGTAGSSEDGCKAGVGTGGPSNSGGEAGGLSKTGD